MSLDWLRFAWKQDPGSLAFAGAVLVIMLGLALAAPNNQMLDLLFQVAIWASIATAWNIIGGYGGQLSLGHSAFYGLGAYGGALLLTGAGLSPIIGIGAGAALAVVLALVVGLAGLRLRGPFFAMVTFVMGPAFQAIATNWAGLTGGSGGVSLPLHGDWSSLIFPDRRIYVFIALGLLALSLYVACRLRYGRTGLHLVAAGGDPEVASSIGIAVLRVRLGGMAVSAALTALAGGLATFYVLFLDPENAFSASLSIKIVTIAVIGGTTSVIGPLLGAIILVPIEQFLSNAFAGRIPGLSGILFGLLLMVVVLVVPGGVVRLLRRGRFLLGRSGGVVRARTGVEAS
jgi:branched-chain amino acid transport system permease protein